MRGEKTRLQFTRKTCNGRGRGDERTPIQLSISDSRRRVEVLSIGTSNYTISILFHWGWRQVGFSDRRHHLPLDLSVEVSASLFLFNNENMARPRSRRQFLSRQIAAATSYQSPRSHLILIAWLRRLTAVVIEYIIQYSSD